VAVGVCNELAWHSADTFVAKLSHIAKISYCQWCMTELRSSWKVGQSVVCNVGFVWKFVYEIGVVLACNVYRTLSTVITAIVIITTKIAGNKCQLDATDDFYCRSYCLLNMFRAQLCPSLGAREYYTSGCCLSYLVLRFQVVGMVWS